ncbi:MAG: asparagine synthase-related protein [Planctomycetota bacterium]
MFHGKNHLVAFWGLTPPAEAIVKPNGWFLGHAYWDDLPQEYTKNSKDLLDTAQDLWRLEGINFLRRLNGSFNLFLHDIASGKSLISTDRFCTYVLWTAELDVGVVAFSPCYDVLRRLVKSRIDLAALWSFMARTRAIGDHTLLEEIRGVRASTAICFGDSSGPTTVEWYTPRFEPEPYYSASFWAAELNTRLRQVMDKQLTGFKAPGLLLSGGLDSRLIASFCPPETRCFTLADFNNQEMKTAAKTAKICGLRHIPIVRDSNWYPIMLEEAVKHCIGLWWWLNAHFMPLETYEGEWQEIDCVLAGFYFDTFLKGYESRPDELWSNAPPLGSAEQAISFLLDFDMSQCKSLRQLEEIMRPEAFQRCREAHQQALRAELERSIPISSSIIDAWELCQFSSIYREPGHPNVTCLTSFIPTRTVIFDNRLYDMYFRVPASVKRTGAVVRWAVWQRNTRLGTLSDSNSWLPMILPLALHEKAIHARKKISRIRNWWYRGTGSKEYRSRGSWPEVGRLWVHHPKMRTVMDNLIDDPPTLLEDFFCMDAVAQAWKRHKDGQGNYPDMLNILAGLGLLQIE